MLFADPFVTKWLFDVELLARLRHIGGQTRTASTDTAAIEMSLRAWQDVKGSRLRWFHMARAPLDLLTIRSHYLKKSPIVGAGKEPPSTHG